jgi:hypothetical protein
MAYQCEATNLPGFINYLAANVLAEGYWWYVHDYIPERKDPRKVDAKMIEVYGLDVSASTRSRRKMAGLANLRYIRFGREFLLLSTKGEHPFFQRESRRDAEDREKRILDASRVAIKICGYSLKVVQGGYLRKVSPDAPPVPDDKLRVRVRIGRERLIDLRAHFSEVALRLSVEEISRAFYAIPFEPYAYVVEQVRKVLFEVNEARKAAGLEEVPPTVIRTKRRIVSPFETLPKELAA